MKVGTQAFPYPVLTSANGPTADFVDSAFQAVVDAEIEEAENQILALVYKFHLSNESIRGLIQSGSATYALEIKCSDTLFRKVFKVKEHGTLKFAVGELHGKVEVTPMIIITKIVNDFSSDDLNEEFQGGPFLLRPGDIIAIDDTLIRYFEFNQLKFESLVKVVLSPHTVRFTYEIDLGPDFIRINMGEKMKAIWNHANENKIFRPYLAMSMYKDCVLVALKEIVFSEDAESYRWARALNSKLAELGVSLSEEPNIDQLNVLAQRITTCMWADKLFKSLKN